MLHMVAAMSEAIVLASASSVRQRLLLDAGVELRVMPARIDEETIRVSMRAEGVSPRDMADTLAEMKSRQVSLKNPGIPVLGADQILEFRRKPLGKPATIAEARSQLQMLRGNQHLLISAAVITLDGQPIWRHVGETRLWMREFTDTYLDGYLDRMGDDVLATVGAYKLEQEGARLFSRIEGDYFTVLGLPLIEILNYLAEAGIVEK